MAAKIRVGVASWSDHEPFYPPEYAKQSMQKERLRYYARYFDLVEVDSTFYHLVSPKVVQGWVERVTPEPSDSGTGAPNGGLWGDGDAVQPADDFIFDVKAYGELTWHHRDDQGQPIAPAAETFERFSAMVQPLRDAGRLGALLFQFPPWFTFGEENLAYFSTLREMLPADTLAVEFRHRSWLEGDNLDETRAVLSENRLAHCAVDEPQIGSGSAPPVVLVTDPHFSMVRFHGRNRRMWYGKNLQSSRDRFDYLYSREELASWAERIQRTAEQLSGSEVHAITNNNARNYAIVNAFDLEELLGLPVANGQPIPEGVLETRRERDVQQANEDDPRE